ncbi:hypothetical protein DE146DRAFT_36157 [Phaeosphaeria sp. MPI-PUGE-AT-0046c]|nr:hypothetical protein DE146DRAFT_36157 [Phaeosphaeria sp. MPI-PUGE-AT-0046c]
MSDEQCSVANNAVGRQSACDGLGSEKQELRRNGGSVEKEISGQSAARPLRHVPSPSPSSTLQPPPLQRYDALLWSALHCTSDLASVIHVHSRRRFFLQSAVSCSAPLHSTPTCHWDAAPVDRVPRRAPSSCTVAHSVSMDWIHCVQQGASALTRSASPGRTVPWVSERAGVATGCSLHRRCQPSFGPRSNPTACYPALQATPSLRILYLDSVESTRRFQKADYQSLASGLAPPTSS